jgi:hypothetical protein
MADQNPQTPQVGVVGQRIQPGQAPQQQAPSQGVPGVQAPPIPSADQIAKVMAEQNRQMQQQIAEARKRAGYDGSVPQQNASQQANSRFSQSSPQQQQVAPQQQQDAPQQQSNQAAHQIPPNIAAMMPPNMRPPEQFSQQQQTQQQEVPSPVYGLTAEQVLAGPPRQQQQHTQPPQQQAPPQRPQGGHIAAYSQPQEAPKDKVPWFPVRGAKDSVDIELTDVIIQNVPSKGMIGESDAGAKVVLALFSEILALRESVQYLMQNSNQVQIPPSLDQLPQRVYALEQTLFEQRNAMQQRARGVREQIAMGQMQGLTPEQILASLSGQQVVAQQMVQQGNLPPAQHTTAEQQAAAQANMVATGTGQAPDSQQVAAPEQAHQEAAPAQPEQPQQQTPPPEQTEDGAQ